MDSVVLYGAPISLYTGRARSYLIKSRIPYTEEPLVATHYYENVLPKAGGRRSAPTLEFSDGRVIRDSVAIVDYFERRNGDAYAPDSPKQRIVSLLLDVIGAEGLLRPAMHYRWNQDQLNTDFVVGAFHRMQGDPEFAEERMAHLRSYANPAMGILPETYAVIERSYGELLSRLQAHFSEHPYFLGSKPCIGDFGMIAPMFGHLGRDPTPLALMQRHACRVFRWVERMNRAEPDMGEFGVKNEVYLADDAVPDTLLEVLKHMARDFVPETRAAGIAINAWLAENPQVPAGTPVERGIGMGSFELEGVPIETIAQPFRFYLLKRVQTAYEGMQADEQAAVRELLSACDMIEVLGLKIHRDIGRSDNLEVWL